MASGAQAENGLSPREAYVTFMQLGRAALTKEAPKKAIVYFSKARRIAPSDLPAQLSLAEAFARNDEVRRAEAFVRYLLNQPEYGKYETQYLAALAKLQTRYPFVASASFAALPSTNIKNTSSATVFDTLIGRFEIDDGGEETSGIGFDVGLQGRYRYPLADGLSFEIGAALNRIWYDDPDLRYWRGRVTTDIKQIGARGSILGGLHFDRTYYADVEGDSSDRIATGLHGQWSRSLSPQTRLRFNGIVEYRDYLDKDTLSGPYASLSSTWVKTLETGAAIVFGGAVERSKPSLGYHRYWGGTLRGGYETNITDTLRAGLSLSAAVRRYDSDFAAVDYPRRDEIFRLGFSVSDSRIKIMGGTPKLSCGYKIQNSNISLYQSTSTDCRIGWSYQF
ncbi:porin family protein [Pacificibacter sp. 1_MG-2023]|nr:porin family protein [Pacificibacter sp. 1_MG-2023]